MGEQGTRVRAAPFRLYADSQCPSRFLVPPEGLRTPDPLITNQVLYQLS